MSVIYYWIWKHFLKSEEEFTGYFVLTGTADIILIGYVFLLALKTLFK